MLLHSSLHRALCKYALSAYLQMKGGRGQRHAVGELHAAKALPSGGWGVQGDPIFVGVLVWGQTEHANSPTCIINQPIHKCQFAKLTVSYLGCRHTT